MSQGKEKPGKPARKPERKTKMKNTKTVKELTTKRQKKEIKSIISDYEANALIAANLIKVIETGDFSAWRQNWHFATTTTDLYYEVVDGFACAYALAAMPITIENSFAGHDDCPLPAGFYLNFKEIKSNNLKLKKGAIGQPLYERKSFYKQLTKLEEETLLKEEDLALEWEILQEDHRHQFKAVFTVTKEDGTTYDFDEIILWDYRKNQPGYQRHQYVLVYYYNNNDLVNPIDIKALWKVGERPIRSAAEKINDAEATKDSYIDRSKVTLRSEHQGHAYYNAGFHSVTMPEMRQFEDGKEYYQVLFHEFSHSTGHFTLLNRKSLYSSHNSWGWKTKNYNKEELVAELSSLFILDNLGIMTEDIFKNSASYMQGWGSSFGTSIKHNIINTLKNAIAAAELVLNKCLKGKKAKKTNKEELKEETTSEVVVATASKVEEVTAKATVKSFAQLKRDLSLGTLVKTIHNYCKPERDGEVRKIAKVQTNAIAFERPEDLDRPSWIWWKDHKVEYIDNIFKVFSKKTNELYFEYEIVK